MAITFHSITFGCRLNTAETEMINRKLEKAGFDWSEDNADIYLINSCAVTGKAEREVKQHVYRTRRNFPDALVVVTGCAATRWLRDGICVKEADLLICNSDKNDMLRFIKAKIKDQKSMIQINDQINGNQADKFESSGRFFVKIQDGCHRFCSYCIVPYLRGLPKSRKIADIVRIVREHENTMAETILTAVNTEAFGRDTGETLTDLIVQLLEKTKIRRISFGSIHPWSLNGEFFKLYRQIKDDPRFVDFFHVPVQSGCDKILKLMKRNYRSAEIMEKLNEIRRINPHAFIGTDIICGFPEETPDDFHDTYDFLKRSPISRFHVFRYSQREGTAAWHMRKRLREPTTSEKKDRSEMLIKLSSEKYTDFRTSLKGRKSEAMVVRKTGKDTYKVILDNGIETEISRIKPVSAGNIIRFFIQP